MTKTTDRAPALVTETRDIAALSPLGRQSRHHSAKQLAGIKKSIQEYGFIGAVIINRQNNVLAGLARLLAAKALGMTEVPVVVIDHLSPEKQRAFVLADNRLAELASWNKEALSLELEELSAFEIDIEATGFSLPEIEAIRFGSPESNLAEDDAPPVRAEAVSQVGDLWVLGDHRLLVGDATSPAALDHLLAGEAVRTVFTDPPYNVAIEGHVTSSKAHGRFVMGDGEMSDEEFTQFLGKSLSQIERVLVPGGVAYVCMDWRHMENVMAAAKANRLELLNLCVWDKGAAGMGSFYRSQHELVFVLKKPGGAHLNNVELGRHGRNRSNIWSYEGVIGFGADKAREREMHPTVKPLALVKDALLDASKKGDVVLDLFGGSGTTLIAAERTGRRARVTELDPRYADVIIRRWEAATGKEAVHAGYGLSFRSVSHGRPERELPPARVRVRVAA